MQYEFKAPVRLEAAEVFWYDDPYGIDPPATWRLLARDGAEWREVQAKTPYGTAIDRYNRVEFEPLTTTALRLEARTAAGQERRHPRMAGHPERHQCGGDSDPFRLLQ